MMPQSGLCQFLGENVNHSTGKKWTFTKDVLDTYPMALVPPRNLPVKVYASKDDEVLPGNAEMAEAVFEDFEYISGPHRIASFRKYLDVIRQYENILGIETNSQVCFLVFVADLCDGCVLLRQA